MVEGRERSAAALVVGVGVYSHAALTALPCAPRDAVAVARLLVDADVCGFPRERVKLLRNEKAQRDAVVDALSRWLPEAGRGAEVVFVFFAGHGMVGRVGASEEGYLMPHDADPDAPATHGVAMRDVARWVQAIQARAVVVCLDCCHAGKVLPRAADPPPRTRDMGLRPSVLPALAGEGRFLIASCGEGEYSLESPELRHGLFTFHLLRGLEGAADRDGDGRVGVAELFEHVSAEVARDSQSRFGMSQKPWKTSTDTGGVYLSTPRPDAAAKATPAVAALRERWRKAGAAAALAEAERFAASAQMEGLIDLLKLLREKADAAAAPLVLRLLAHEEETVRRRARAALQAISWPKAAEAALDCARGGDSQRCAGLLDGLTALEAHADGVALLDRLAQALQGDLRNRAILLLERKRLALTLEETAAVFRQHQLPYRLVRVLGQGLYTAAYLGHHDDADLDLVIRVLLPEAAARPQVRANFLDLARRAAKLVHQNLVHTMETRALAESRLYFVVRHYVDAPTLQRLRDQGRRFTIPEVIEIARQVLEALTPAHRQNLPHGGVKPSNLFLYPDGRVVLGDPSLPPQASGAGERRAYDYRYAAPETFRGGGVFGPAADLYALGCVAYELLCGEPPFVSDNPFELGTMHTRDAAPPPRERCAELEAVGAAVVLRLLAKEPGGRFASVAEGLAAVDGWRAALRDKPMPPPPIIRPQQYATLNSIVPDEPGFGGDNPDDDLGPAPAEAVPDDGPRPPPPTVGQPSSIGPYTVRRTLGQGASGVVYLCYDKDLAREIAVKVLHPSAHHAESSVLRFQREARVVATLMHPNIVPVFQLGRHGGGYFIASAYIPGRPLSDLIPESGIEPRRAARLTIQLLEALEYAHSRMVLHRDVKPSNAMVVANGRQETLYLMDFGLAGLRTMDDTRLTRDNVILGTPAYMAPEQARGAVAELGPAADQYSAGVVLYELLTGHLPFESGSIHAMLASILYTAPPAPSQRRPGLLSRLDAICLKALSKRPQDRYRSCREFADALRAFLDDGETAYVPDAPQNTPSAVPVLSPAEECGPAQTVRPGFWRRVAAWFGWRR